MANLDLTVGSPYRPTIDGVISYGAANYTDWGQQWNGSEYEDFTPLKMYIAGKPNSTNHPYTGIAYVAYGEDQCSLFSVCLLLVRLTAIVMVCPICTFQTAKTRFWSVLSHAVLLFLSLLSFLLSTFLVCTVSRGPPTS